MEDVRKRVRESGNAKLVEGYSSVQEGVIQAFTQVDSIIRMVRASVY